jgi:hypothetical protein
MRRRKIPNVTLLNEYTGVMDGLGKTKLEDPVCTTFQQILDLQTQDVIKMAPPRIPVLMRVFG